MQGVIILAAGVGKRMQSPTSKQYLKLKGQYLLSHTLKNIKLALPEARLVLVYKKEDESLLLEAITEAKLKKEDFILTFGGKERQDSVYEGLKVLPKDVDKVFIHDGARPFVSRALIRRLLEAYQEIKAVIPVLPAKDTIKVLDEDKRVSKTLKRETLALVQTPQLFEKALILACHEQARKEGILGTDDASLLEAYGHKVATVLGDEANQKLTVKEDLAWAEWRLERCELE